MAAFSRGYLPYLIVALLSYIVALLTFNRWWIASQHRRKPQAPLPMEPTALLLYGLMGAGIWAFLLLAWYLWSGR